MGELTGVTMDQNLKNMHKLMVSASKLAGIHPMNVVFMGEVIEIEETGVFVQLDKRRRQWVVCEQYAVLDARSGHKRNLTEVICREDVIDSSSAAKAAVMAAVSRKIDAAIDNMEEID